MPLPPAKERSDFYKTFSPPQAIFRGEGQKWAKAIEGHLAGIDPRSLGSGVSLVDHSAIRLSIDSVGWILILAKMPRSNPLVEQNIMPHLLPTSEGKI